MLPPRRFADVLMPCHASDSISRQPRKQALMRENIDIDGAVPGARQPRYDTPAATTRSLLACSRGACPPAARVYAMRAMMARC